MEKIKLITESYLFNGQSGTFRAIPFFELGFTEFVIYEDGVLKYYFDINRKTDPMVIMFVDRVNQGISIDEVIEEFGKRLNRHWTTHHGLPEELPDSWQNEEVELYHLKDLNDISQIDI